eukprot:scpid92441/ scgid15466/ Proactivator polypeptide; Saposin-A; Saposin-B; Saposin-C; Saposin-D
MLKSVFLVTLLAVAAHQLAAGNGDGGAPAMSKPASGKVTGISGAFRKLVKLLSDATPTLECSLCELVIKEIIAEVAKNSTQQKLIHGMEDVCQKLPDVDDCVDFFKQYGSQLIDTVLLLLPPKAVCTFASACPNSTITLPLAPASAEQRSREQAAAPLNPRL